LFLFPIFSMPSTKSARIQLNLIFYRSFLSINLRGKTV
jgi:hypothetical protein